MRHGVEARSYRQPRVPSDRHKEQKVCIIESTVLPINETIRLNRQLAKTHKGKLQYKEAFGRQEEKRRRFLGDRYK